MDQINASRRWEWREHKVRFALRAIAVGYLGLFGLVMIIGEFYSMGIVALLLAAGLIALRVRLWRRETAAAEAAEAETEQKREAAPEPPDQPQAAETPDKPQTPQTAERPRMSEEEFLRRAAEVDAELRRQNKLGTPSEKEVFAYADAEREAVEKHIAEAFGPIERVYYDGDNGGFRIDVAVSAPVEEEREYYTLTTIGMGSRRMDVPAELAEKNRAYAELAICLPPDWDLMNDTWPFRLLQETARRPFAERRCLETGAAYRDGTLNEAGFTGVLILPAPTREETSHHLMVPGGKIVNFYLLLPVDREEWSYMLERKSSYPLWRRYMESGQSLVVQPGRESCVDPETWFEEDIGPFTWTDGEEKNELCLEVVSWRSEIWESAGMQPDGLAWEKLAQAYLVKYRPEAQDAISFDSSESVFCAESGSGKELRAFALAFHDFCCSDEAMANLLKEM